MVSVFAAGNIKCKKMCYCGKLEKQINLPVETMGMVNVDWVFTLHRNAFPEYAAGPVYSCTFSGTKERQNTKYDFNRDFYPDTLP